MRMKLYTTGNKYLWDRSVELEIYLKQSGVFISEGLITVINIALCTNYVTSSENVMFLRYRYMNRLIKVSMLFL